MTKIVKIKEMLWARMCLRGCNHVGELPRLQGHVQVRNTGSILIGDRMVLRGSHVPIELAALPGGLLEIGNHCFINSGASICASLKVKMGNYCMIGNYTVIMDTDFHDLYDRRSRGESAPVILEDEVWIGAGVTILKGVTIGTGSAVAAGSVVVKDVPPHTLVGGVPAKVIKSLLPETQRNSLDGYLASPPTPAAKRAV